jgi:peptidyl-prolyl cis-trans isomerase A (cyclophilin A)
MRILGWAAALILIPGAQDEKPKAPEIPKVLLDPSLPEWKEKAPDTFKARFTTSKGDFTVLVERAWAPLGADRFFCLVKNGYFDDVRFFRVITGFMAQCGLHGAPEVNKAWRDATIADDPVVKSNLRGWLSYAIRGPNTRTTQFFINFKDNKSLNSQKFAPFGQVVEGMEIVDKLYSKYGDGPPRGRGPDQVKLRELGNAYLAANFKELDYIKSAKIVAK